MTAFALALVLVAALAHATWNLILKKAHGGPAFMTLVAMVATVLWAPVATGAWIVQDYRFEWIHLAPILASAAIHTGYFLLLDRGYRFGDLSVVYPLARATGPLLTVGAAIFFLGERPGAIGLAGALLVVAGAYLLTGNPLKLFSRDRPRGTGFALLTGLTIAAYTLVDKLAVSRFMIPPIVFDWACLLTRSAMLLPIAGSAAALRQSWRVDRRAIVMVAILSPLAYILVLTALVFTPVSLVAPAREMSILFGALMGAHFLKERDARRRILAAGAIVLGIAGLALG
ncbi:MAG: DMT family transporter [Burkholderiales bacterium]|jgi:drug/metabolite transporter (DMT)-like permease|nr:DMT family transporter [Burkholderiales bacterium]